MKLSNLFTKTTKDYPKDEQSISAQLLIRAGYIDKVAAGVYTLLPLGLRVTNKISDIIRKEMVAIDGQEIFMPTLVPKDNWILTGRWTVLDVLFRIKARDEKDYGLGASHEEIVTPLTKKYALSYKDLPFAVFQIQNKFRDELRAKSGVLRTREFLMKDLYSFHADEDDLDKYYDRVTEAYWKIFAQVGIKEKTYFTFASGGTFAKYSHEFQTETEAGEDEVYVCRKCKMGLNREILEKEYKCPECGAGEYDLKKCVEIGNIFKPKTKYSEPFDQSFTDKLGQRKMVLMGCYGIGIQRLMGTVAEVTSDEKGLNWPQSIAPFAIQLIEVKSSNPEVRKKTEKIYQELQEAGIEVLYDDRDLSAGEKFADADLLGIPWRAVISEKTGDKVELKKRNSDKSELVEPEKLQSI